MAEQADMFGGAQTSARPSKLPPPTLYAVPAGTLPGKCKGETCGATVYWIKALPAPVSCDVDGGAHPTRTDAGRGWSHFLNCPDAAQFSKSGKGSRRRA